MIFSSPSYLIYIFNVIESPFSTTLAVASFDVPLFLFPCNSAYFLTSFVNSALIHGWLEIWLVNFQAFGVLAVNFTLLSSLISLWSVSWVISVLLNLLRLAFMGKIVSPQRCWSLNLWMWFYLETESLQINKLR